MTGTPDHHRPKVGKTEQQKFLDMRASHSPETILPPGSVIFIIINREEVSSITEKN
jgi:hypothetical protein